MRAIWALIGAAAVAACSNDPRLHNITAGQDTPDEFAIVPTRPLLLPPDLNQLPQPTPGGTNLTDPNPKGDAVAALGGDPQRLTPSGIGSADGALVNYTSRLGVTPGIRQQVAQEDVELRASRSRRLLEVWAKTDVYYRAYEPMTLDSWAENERWKRAGARTPSAPPLLDE
ncbi:DUF3035 domain-containing protein [Paracoccus aerodenitrificans]|uniref:DUF3035 domain-containing protein n=1 Tax=Paracoccus aerodenitrificans TaxID=3017781 RepID=UPI0022F0F21B|nr:DUF3035 domain-containing protein [Paracoccus aerodenitrificans]WBU64091.1 DUF3035 domain-containing protein [Paracoccus aerodenitrificans]